MSLSAALRAASPSTASATPTVTAAAAPVSSSPSDPPRLHFFPLPQPPRWSLCTLATGGAALPAAAAHTLSAMNHGRTLLLYGGNRGQTATATGLGAATHQQQTPAHGASIGGAVGGGSISGGSAGAGLAGSGAGAHALPLLACSSLSSDTFLYDVGSGRCIGMGPRFGAETSHTARAGHAAAVIDQHTLYVSGGWNGRKYVTSGLLVDLKQRQMLYEANNTAAKLQQLQQQQLGGNRAAQMQPKVPSRVLPPPRRDQSLCMVGSKQMFLLHGWDGEECLSDAWICKLTKPAGTTAKGASADKTSTWQWSPFPLASGSSYPSPRRGHSACTIGSCIWVFGGLSGYSTYRNDVHVLDTKTHLWSSPPASAFSGSTPSPRAWHSCCAVGTSGYLLFFGGVGPQATFLNDLHLLDTKANRWYALVQSSVQSEERIAAGKVAAFASDLPSPRASHAACMVGSRLFIHGGLAPQRRTNSVTGEVEVQIEPCSEMFELETFLPAEMFAGQEPEEEEDEEMDGEEDTAAAEDEGDSTSASDDDASDSGRPHIRRAASLSPADPSASLGLAATEGWLAISGPTTNVAAAAASEKKSDHPVAVGGHTTISSSNANNWSRRFVRLDKHSLLAYQPSPSGSLQVAADGVVAEWIDVNADVLVSLARRAAGQVESLDWIGEAPAIQQRQPSVFGSSSLPTSGSSDSVSQLHGGLLAKLLADPTATRHSQFQAFLSPHALAHTMLQFNTAVEAFARDCAETGSPDAAAQQAQVKSIYDKFLQPGAVLESSLPAPMISEIRGALQRCGIVAGGSAPAAAPSTALLASVFQSAQHHVFHVLREDWLPRYLEYISAPAQQSQPAMANACADTALILADLARQQRAKGAPNNVATAARVAQQFKLKQALNDTDRSVVACSHCLVKFSSKSTKHRVFCAYCSGVFCDSCVNNNTTLPAEYQRIVGGSVTRVRVCDPCDHVLTMMNKADNPVALSATAVPKKLFAFHYTNRQTNQPIHLASESRTNVQEWVSALNQSMTMAAQTDGKTSSSSGSSSGGGGSGSNGGSPEKAAASSTSASSADAAPAAKTVYREGWLMREDAPGSKLFKRTYVQLSGTTLTFFDLFLKKNFSLVRSSTVQQETDVVNISASGYGSQYGGHARSSSFAGGSSLESGGAFSDPSRWPTLHPFSITNALPGSSAFAAMAASSVLFAAETAAERSRWIAMLTDHIKLMAAEEKARGTSGSVVAESAPAATTTAAAVAAASGMPAVRRFRSVSAVPDGGAASAAGSAPGPGGLATSLSALSLLSSLTPQQQHSAALSTSVPAQRGLASDK